MTQRKLSLEDRKDFEKTALYNQWDSFYHYFPLVCAMSETSKKKWWWDDTFGDLWCGQDECFIASDAVEVYFEKKCIDRVWVMPYRCHRTIARSELYDINYIYDLEQTIQIKNFRKNVQRFEKEHNHMWVDVGDEGDARAVIEKWYGNSKRKEFTDFGYTLWFAEHLRHSKRTFPDLRSRFVFVNDEPVAWSLWGTLNSETGIHVICKDIGWPYLQDYTRMMTYKDMIEAGLKTVNDGSDCGEHGIRMYKLKLRPKFIIPLWTWMMELGDRVE